MQSYLRISIGLLFLLMVSSCGGSSSTTDTTPTTTNPVNWQPISNGWTVGDATQEGFNVTALNTAYDMARDTNVLRSLLVVRNEQLIAEAYFRGTTSNSLLHERSVTKTVMAMLIGVAIDEGYLNSIEQNIGELLATDFPDLSTAKKAITIEHLLTMTSGFQWDESQVNGYTDWANSNDPQGYLLNRDLVATSGTVFNYNSAATHVLSIILSKATGLTTLEYANQKIFQPLGITQLRWEVLADGYHNGAAGLELRAADLAKIGLMMQNNGQWQQQTIVPKQWLDAAKSHQLNLTPGAGPFLVDGYGYLTWLGTGNGFNIQLAWGWGGQFIAIIPEKNMVVIINCDWQVSGQTASSQYAVAFDILINHIMNAAN